MAQGEGPQDLEKKWIVLIQKAPHGPLTKEEITILIEQKVVRHNDVASLVSPKSEAGWKFLWQFEEFDRRLTETPEAAAAAAEIHERRTKPPPVITLENIPADLREISADELLLKTRRVPPPERTTPSDNPPTSGGEEMTLPSFKTVAISASMLSLLVVAAMTLRGRFKSKAPQQIVTFESNDVGPSEIGNGPLSNMPQRIIPRTPTGGPGGPGNLGPPPLGNRAPVVIEDLPNSMPRDLGPREPERGEVPRETALSVDEEEGGDEEITEEDILEAKAFKAKKARAKRRRPAARASEEDEDTGESENAEPPISPEE